MEGKTDMLTCREVSRLISDSQERKLPMGIRFKMRLHLVMCKNCRTYEMHVHLMRDIAKNLSDAKFSEMVSLSDEIKAKLKKIIAER